MTIIITIIVTALATIIAGLALPFIEQKFFKHNNMPTKILTNDILNRISPGRSLAKAKEILGIPDKSFDDSFILEDPPAYIEEIDAIKSDIYFLENAVLKISTLDERSIHSITVLNYDDTLDYPYTLQENIDGGTKVFEELITNARKITSVRTMRDSATAIQHYTGSPLYKYITYFIERNIDYEENPDYKSLIGEKMIGFCFSDGDMALYIYDGEVR